MEDGSLCEERAEQLQPFSGEDGGKTAADKRGREKNEPDPGMGEGACSVHAIMMTDHQNQLLLRCYQNLSSKQFNSKL